MVKPMGYPGIYHCSVTYLVSLFYLEWDNLGSFLEEFLVGKFHTWCIKVSMVYPGKLFLLRIDLIVIIFS